MFIDVRKAHLIPVCNEKVFVELPDGRVVRLKKWLCGMRKAASSCEEFYKEKFVEKVFSQALLVRWFSSTRRLL